MLLFTANPFVLTTNRLTDIALFIRKYVGEGHPTIGCFSRITDIRNKTVEELHQLHHLGFDYLTIGVESGDSETLTRVNKGYLSEDIIEQCRKLEEADIHYQFFYLVGLGGHGNGERNALRSAGVFNQLHPVSIGFLSLTLFPESQLYQEIQPANAPPPMLVTPSGMSMEVREVHPSKAVPSILVTLNGISMEEREVHS